MPNALMFPTGMPSVGSVMPVATPSPVAGFTASRTDHTRLAPKSEKK